MIGMAVAKKKSMPGRIDDFSKDADLKIWVPTAKRTLASWQESQLLKERLEIIGYVPPERTSRVGVQGGS